MSTLPFGPQPFRIVNYSVFEGWTSTSIRFWVCTKKKLWGVLKFFQYVSSGLLIFHLAPRGGGSDKSLASVLLLNPRRPGETCDCRVVSYFPVFFCCGCRFISYFTVCSVPPAHILEPSWVHLGASWGHFGAILGPSWGHFGAILGSSIIQRAYCHWLCTLTTWDRTNAPKASLSDYEAFRSAVGPLDQARRNARSV